MHTHDASPTYSPMMNQIHRWVSPVLPTYTSQSSQLRRHMLTKSPSIAILTCFFSYTMGAPCTPTTRLAIVLTFVVRTQPSPTTLMAITFQCVMYTVRFTVTLSANLFTYLVLTLCSALGSSSTTSAVLVSGSLTRDSSPTANYHTRNAVVVVIK